MEFDGTGISVFELKRDIIIKSGLGDGTDFDLAIYNEDGNEGTALHFLCSSPVVCVCFFEKPITDTPIRIRR